MPSAHSPLSTAPAPRPPTPPLPPLALRIGPQIKSAASAENPMIIPAPLPSGKGELPPPPTARSKLAARISSGSAGGIGEKPFRPIPTGPRLALGKQESQSISAAAVTAVPVELKEEDMDMDIDLEANIGVNGSRATPHLAGESKSLLERISPSGPTFKVDPEPTLPVCVEPALEVSKVNPLKRPTTPTGSRSAKRGTLSTHNLATYIPNSTPAPVSALPAVSNTPLVIAWPARTESPGVTGLPEALKPLLLPATPVSALRQPSLHPSDYPSPRRCLSPVSHKKRTVSTPVHSLATPEPIPYYPGSGVQIPPSSPRLPARPFSPLSRSGSGRPVSPLPRRATPMGAQMAKTSRISVPMPVVRAHRATLDVANRLVGMLLREMGKGGGYRSDCLKDWQIAFAHGLMPFKEDVKDLFHSLGA
jgi:hypothetical protein